MRKGSLFGVSQSSSFMRLNLWLTLSKIKMTSIGRGRGWAQNTENSLRKPGRPLPSEDNDSATLIDMINLIDDKNSKEKLEEIMKFINSKIQKENLRDVYKKLYKYALNNSKFKQKLIIAHKSDVFKDISDSNGIKLRRHLMELLQADYERRKELRQENLVQFHNAVCFFHEALYHTNVLPSYDVCPSIVEALVDYMEMLLEIASEDDIKIFVEIIVLHGKRFPHIFKDNEDSLLIRVREILIKKNLSPSSRQMLLYVIDTVNYHHKPLPKNLQKFYELQISKDFI